MMCLTDIKVVYVSKTHRDDKRKIINNVILYDHNLLIRNCGLKRHTKTVTLLRIFVFYFALI